jgi:hypothetical protein
MFRLLRFKGYLREKGSLAIDPEGEDYDKTLTPVIEEIVPIFMKTTRTTMIHI